MTHDYDEEHAGQNGVPTVLQIALPPELISSLDKHRHSLDRHRHSRHAALSREETIVVALRTWARSLGLLEAAHGSDEGLRPEDLNATNDD